MKDGRKVGKLAFPPNFQILNPVCILDWSHLGLVHTALKSRHSITRGVESRFWTPLNTATEKSVRTEAAMKITSVCGLNPSWKNWISCGVFFFCCLHFTKSNLHESGWDKNLGVQCEQGRSEWTPWLAYRVQSFKEWEILHLESAARLDRSPRLAQGKLLGLIKVRRVIVKRKRSSFS